MIKCWLLRFRIIFIIWYMCATGKEKWDCNYLSAQEYFLGYMQITRFSHSARCRDNFSNVYITSKIHQHTYCKFIWSSVNYTTNDTEKNSVTQFLIEIQSCQKRSNHLKKLLYELFPLENLSFSTNISPTRIENQFYPFLLRYSITIFRFSGQRCRNDIRENLFKKGEQVINDDG